MFSGFSQNAAILKVAYSRCLGTLKFESSRYGESSKIKKTFEIYIQPASFFATQHCYRSPRYCTTPGPMQDDMARTVDKLRFRARSAAREAVLTSNFDLIDRATYEGQLLATENQ